MKKTAFISVLLFQSWLMWIKGDIESLELHLFIQFTIANFMKVRSLYCIYSKFDFFIKFPICYFISVFLKITLHQCWQFLKQKSRSDLSRLYQYFFIRFLKLLKEFIWKTKTVKKISWCLKFVRKTFKGAL